MEPKVCTSCELPKDPSEFYNRKASPDGKSSICIECEKKNHRKYYAEKQKKVKRQEAGRKSKLKVNYRLTLDEYQHMWLDQGGRCKICKNSLTKAVVDHDHKTGQPRGILCPNCNHGLGRFFDNVEYLKNAITYLEASNGRDTPIAEGKGLTVRDEQRIRDMEISRSSFRNT